MTREDRKTPRQEPSGSAATHAPNRTQGQGPNQGGQYDGQQRGQPQGGQSGHPRPPSGGSHQSLKQTMLGNVAPMSPNPSADMKRTMLGSAVPPMDAWAKQVGKQPGSPSGHPNSPQQGAQNRTAPMGHAVPQTSGTMPFGAAAQQRPGQDDPAATLHQGSPSPGGAAAVQPKVKVRPQGNPMNRTLLGIPASGEGLPGIPGAPNQRQAGQSGMPGSPVLPVGADGQARQNYQGQAQQGVRSTTPQGHYGHGAQDARYGQPNHQHGQGGQAPKDARREREDPKTMPAVPIESYETPRNAREAVIRDSMTHGPRNPDPGVGPFTPRHSIPHMPPLRNSLSGMGLSKVGNKTLFAVLAGAAIIVIGVELFNQYRAGQGEANMEDLEAYAAEGANFGVEEARLQPTTAVSQPATTGASTRIVTTPEGAEILYRGSVIATTPAAVRRPEIEADYLLRKEGFEPQLIQLNAKSPDEIQLELHPLSEDNQGAAQDEQPDQGESAGDGDETAENSAN